MFVDKHGHGKGGGLENENKRASRKIRISAGRLQCIKSTLILDFIKRYSRPPSGGSFTAYGILLCYANFNAMLVCYIGEIQTVSSYMVELGWVEIA